LDAWLAGFLRCVNNSDRGDSRCRWPVSKEFRSRERFAQTRQDWNYLPRRNGTPVGENS